MCKELPCKGRPCAKCHKCRDWHFIGDQYQWDWVWSYLKWNVADWTGWRGHEHIHRECSHCRHGCQCSDCPHCRDASQCRECRESHDCRDDRECPQCRDCPECGAYKLFTKGDGIKCNGFRRESGLGISDPGTYLTNYGDDIILPVAAGAGYDPARASYVGGGHLCHCEIH
jgi:hypothetical protein